MPACDRCVGEPGVHRGVPGHREGQVQGEPAHGAHHVAQPAPCQRGCTLHHHFVTDVVLWTTVVDYGLISNFENNFIRTRLK